MKNLSRTILFIVLALLAGGAVFYYWAYAPSTFSKSETIMGTTLEITVSGPASSQKTQAMLSKMRTLFDQLNARSIKSDIALINALAGTAPAIVKNDTFDVIAQAAYISKKTWGAFDLTVGPLSNLWTQAEKKQKLPKASEIRKLKKLVNYRWAYINRKTKKVKLKKNRMKLDLGNITRGYILDEAIAELKKSGITSAMLSAGGSTTVIGEQEKGKPWKISIRHPKNLDSVMGVVSLGSGWAIAASSSPGQYFTIKNKILSRTISPKTGFPANKCQAAAIIARSAALANGLSDAIFVLDPQKGLKLLERLPDVEGLIITPGGKILKTSGFILEGKGI